MLSITDARIARKVKRRLSEITPVRQVVVYGSRARGKPTKYSDIDLTLHGRDLTLNVIYRILDDLDELLLPYTIDLSLFKDISDPDVIEHIERVGVTFYDRSEAIPEAA